MCLCWFHAPQAHLRWPFLQLSRSLALETLDRSPPLPHCSIRGSSPTLAIATILQQVVYAWERKRQRNENSWNSSHSPYFGRHFHSNGQRNVLLSILHVQQPQSCSQLCCEPHEEQCTAGICLGHFRVWWQRHGQQRCGHPPRGGRQCVRGAPGEQGGVWRWHELQHLQWFSALHHIIQDFRSASPFMLLQLKEYLTFFILLTGSLGNWTCDNMMKRWCPVYWFKSELGNANAICLRLCIHDVWI